MPTPARFLSAIAVLLLVLPAAARAQVPPVPVPPQNPITPAKVVLGKILFWEEQVGRDNTTACGTCHRPEVGGGDPRALSPLNVHPGPDGNYGTADDIRGSRGVVHCDQSGNFTPDGTFFPANQVTGRKAPPAIGAAWDPETFWDGRAGSAFKDPITQQVLIPVGGALENQALGPPSSGEMGCDGTNMAIVCAKLAVSRPLRLATALTPDIQAALAQNPTYPALFAAAFGDPAITPARFAMAIATYERTLVPDQTPFDLFVSGNVAALTPTQQLGLQLFTGIGFCSQCHGAPLFTDSSYRNIGLRPPAEDPGRQNVTQDPADRGKFKVPGLRNVGLRAPYFHTGGAWNLMDVALFYNRGGDFLDNLDPLIQPISLSHPELVALVDFLQNGLTDPRVANQTAPFDRPVLRSELPPNASPYGSRTPGTGGRLPMLLAHLPPVIGADRFGLGIADGLGGALAVIGISALPAAPGAMLGALPLWITLDPQTLLLPLPLGGTPGVAGEGYGSIVVSLPDTPVLNGLSLYAQGLVADPGVVAGAASTEGAVFTFFAP